MGAPKTFGRYQLLQVAGSGGMAQVHLARQIGPEGFIKPCVLKRIADEHLHSESVRRMFLEEARISALLNHPRIVQTFDYGEVDGTPYMAMELVDGVNVSQLCRTLAQHGRWIPLQPAVEIILGVLDALDYAHSLVDLQGQPLRLVHRDVSPQNTLLSRLGMVKLGDFGIARHDARETETVGLTAKGKPGYMAPEQAMSGQVDLRADLFAVGVMLTELISARRVLDKQNRGTGMLAIEARVRELCQLRKEAPPELTELAVRLAALDPNRRPQSAREAAGYLKKVSARVPPSVSLQDFLRSVFDTYLKDEHTSANVPTVPLNEAPTHIVSHVLPAPPEASASELAFEEDAWDRSEDQPTGTQAVYEQGWPEDYLPSAPPPAPQTAPRSAPQAAPPPTPQTAPPSHAAAEDLELVAHSSSVEAMQYFQAQVSEDVARQSLDEEQLQTAELERVRQRGVPYQVTGRHNTTGDHPAPPADSARSTDLPMPAFNPEEAPASSAPNKGMLGFEDPALKKALATIATEEDGKPTGAGGKKGFSIPPVIPLLGAGLVVGALGIGLLALFSQGTKKAAPVAPKVGVIEVKSVPPGGLIFVDGRATGRSTPTVLADLPVEKPIRIAVRREGYLSAPPDAVIRIPQATLRTSATFTLRPGRAFKVTTTPSDATITVNDHHMGATPLVLPVVPFGESATITVRLEGFLPARRVLVSAADTATVSHIELEPGKTIEIASNPPGARVSMDGEVIGTTPLYDVLVPADRRFVVKMTHKGFRSWRKRFSGRTLAGEPLVADLRPLPFLALPWNAQEKRRARQLDRLQNQQSRTVERLKSKLRSAEARQAQVESSINASVGDLADVQRRTDLTREALSSSEQDLSDTEAQMETLREQLLLRMDAE